MRRKLMDVVIKEVDSLKKRGSGDLIRQLHAAMRASPFKVGALMALLAIREHEQGDMSDDSDAVDEVNSKIKMVVLEVEMEREARVGHG
jgi:hypothetical protein